MKNAYVVGYGLIDALGNNPRDCFSNIINDQDYAQDVPEMVAEDHKIHRGMIVEEDSIQLPPNHPKTLTKMQRMAFHTVQQALDMSKLPPNNNVSVITTTIVNNMETHEEIHVKLTNKKRIHPRTLLNSIPDMIANHISLYYQYHGATTGILAACASGNTAIDYAMRLIDEYDYVIVVGGDAGCIPLSMKYFHSLGAMDNYSKPFDDTRNGFVMGEGCGALILQSEEMVKKYNSQVHAKLYPVGLANDAYHDTSPDPDGKGATLSMTKALSHVNGKVHAVNAHATSTPLGDVVEYQAVTNLLGNIPIYAPKSKLGHTMGASGIVEAIYSIESMKNNLIPHIHNLEECSIDSLNCLVRKNLELPQEDTLRTLNNSFGFGGKCASQVIEVSKT